MEKSIDKKLRDFFNNYPEGIFDKNETIISAAENTQVIHYLKKGRVRMYSVSPEGNELTLHIYNPRSFFPMASVLDDYQNHHYYDALNKVQVNTAPSVQVVNFLLKEPEILYCFTQRILYALSGLSHRIEINTFFHADKRVASVLLYLARHFSRNPTSNKIKLNKYFSHEEISWLVGVTRERVSIEMGKLKKQGLIDYEKRQIIIINKRNLEKYLST